MSCGRTTADAGPLRHRARAAHAIAAVLTVLAVVLGPAVVAAPVARAEPIGDIVGRQEVTHAAEVIAQHSGDITTGTIGAGVAAGFCGPAAPGCALLVGVVAGAYQQYAATVNNAARHHRCVRVFFGDNIGEVSGVPYVGEYDGVGCGATGLTDLNDPIMKPGG